MYEINCFIFMTTLKIKSKIHAHIHTGGKHFYVYLTFTCTDLQSVNAKYFENHLIITVLYKSHTEVQCKQVFITEKILGTSNTSTVYSITLLFPGPLIQCSFLRNHRLFLGPNVRTIIK